MGVEICKALELSLYISCFGKYLCKVLNNTCMIEKSVPSGRTTVRPQVRSFQIVNGSVKTGWLIVTLRTKLLQYPYMTWRWWDERKHSQSLMIMYSMYIINIGWNRLSSLLLHVLIKLNWLWSDWSIALHDVPHWNIRTLVLFAWYQSENVLLGLKVHNQLIFLCHIQ